VFLPEGESVGREGVHHGEVPAEDTENRRGSGNPRRGRHGECRQVSSAEL
jgi:hypothetical protein